MRGGKSDLIWHRTSFPNAQRTAFFLLFFAVKCPFAFRLLGVCPVLWAVDLLLGSSRILFVLPLFCFRLGAHVTCWKINNNKKTPTTGWEYTRDPIKCVLIKAWQLRKKSKENKGNTQGQEGSRADQVRNVGQNISMPKW